MIAVAVKEGAAGAQLNRLLADLASAEGDWPNALARYKLLLATSAGDPLLLQQAGIAALRVGALAEAVVLLDKAVAKPFAGWRAWNARAIAADWQLDWATADRAYARAEELAPPNAQVLNNKGWSLLLRGEWTAALQLLSRAATLAPLDDRIAANLDLARSAASATLPVRKNGESGEVYAGRLNDAGVAAALRGDRLKAIAAFAQALDASDRWFARAANNLALVEQSK
jgi:Flp pilus assembly protein TadD